MIKLIKEVADELLLANNQVTTLEIKLELRKKYPFNFWSEDNVSEAMKELSDIQGLYDYTFNGTFRTYYHQVVGSEGNQVSKFTTTYSPLDANTTLVSTSITLPPKTSKGLSKKKLAKALSQEKSKKISESKLMDLILETAGKLITITYIKEDGSTRILNGVYDKGQAVSGTGKFIMKDYAIYASNKKNNVNESVLRYVNIQTVITARIDKKLYRTK